MYQKQKEPMLKWLRRQEIPNDEVLMRKIAEFSASVILPLTVCYELYLEDHESEVLEEKLRKLREFYK